MAATVRLLLPQPRHHEQQQQQPVALENRSNDEKLDLRKHVMKRAYNAELIRSLRRQGGVFSDARRPPQTQPSSPENSPFAVPLSLSEDAEKDEDDEEEDEEEEEEEENTTIQAAMNLTIRTESALDALERLLAIQRQNVPLDDDTEDVLVFDMDNTETENTVDSRTPDLDNVSK